MPAETVASNAPVVSVVIPTRNRPALELRAVRSVLEQTMPALELTVCVDGPDTATEAALAEVTDTRLRILVNPEPRGPELARNAAAAYALTPWIAFLDDDDEWLPDKLERQLAEYGPEQDVVVSCRCRVRTPRGTYVWPRHGYRIWPRTDRANSSDHPLRLRLRRIDMPGLAD